MKSRPAGNQNLAVAIEEAQSILARHNGCCCLHSSYHALLLYQALEEEGASVEDEDIERVLTEMRLAAQTGIPPQTNPFDNIQQRSQIRFQKAIEFVQNDRT